MENRYFTTNDRLTEQELRECRWFDFPVQELTATGAFRFAEPPLSDDDADALSEDEQSIQDAINRKAQLKAESEKSGIPVIEIPHRRPKPYAPQPKIRIPQRDADKPISEQRQSVTNPETSEKNSARETKNRPNRVHVGNEIVEMSDHEWENI